MTISIPNYITEEIVHEGKNSLIFKAFHKVLKRTVMIKLLNYEYPTTEQLARFQHEYFLTLQLEKALPGLIIRPLELIKFHNSLALVFEDFQGISLSKVLQKGPLDVTTFFDLAIQITEIIGKIHTQNVLIKDVNPSNILWNQLTNEIKIIDFGISTNLTSEKAPITSPNVIEGTLLYISPEQTGRMNRSIDYRSDYYSLGITFFEMLTGKTPFNSQDPMELVHAHIAKIPKLIHENKFEIPVMLSKIVSKLLNKNPEDRYQSSFGIINDLIQCQNFWSTKHAIPFFELGKTDISSHFQLSEKLYGRESQIKSLLQSYEKVCQGKAILTLIKGVPGVGKSSLVHEIYKPISAHRGYFISGKFEQFKRNIPYEPLVQGFKNLLQFLLTESSEKILQWKKLIQTGVGINGKVLTDIIPELKNLIGDQPEIEEAGPEEIKNRFQFVFKNFIQVFASQEHPLSIFLDDLQWADLPTLDLLNYLLSDSHSHHLFIVGSYRDNEVDQSHQLALTINDLKKNKIEVEQIKIEPLQQHHVTQLLADSLHSPSLKVHELSQICYLKTLGNPFFLNQLLLSLYSQHLIWFNFQTGLWEWNIEQIKTKEISQNVIEFMSQKILELPSSTLDILKIAACLGNHFTLTMLAQITQKTSIEVKAYLWKALEEGLIIPESGTYKLISKDFDLPASFHFLHDRVQQAAYSLIPFPEKSLLHYQIGTNLYNHCTSLEIDDKIFEITNHLNSGSEHINSEDQKLQLIHLNIKASKKAKESSAFKSSATYLEKASSLLPMDAWSKLYSLTYQILKNYSEVLYISGEHERAEKIVKDILNQSRDSIEKAEIFAMQVSLYRTNGKMQEAIQAGITGLKMLGIHIPLHPTKFQILKEFILTRWNLGKKTVASLKELAWVNDPRIHLASLLIHETNMATYYAANPNLTALMILKKVNLSLENGNHPGSSMSFLGYAMILNIMGRLKESYEFGKLALDLSAISKNQQLRGRILATYAMLIHGWNYHWKTLTPFFKEAIQTGLETGDLITTLNGCSSILLWDPTFSLETVYKESPKYLELIQKSHNQNACYSTQIEFQLRANLAGKTLSPYSLSDKNFNEEECLKQLEQAKFYSGLALFYKAKAIIYFHQGDHVNSQVFSTLATQYIKALGGSLFYAENCLYAFYIHSQLFDKLSWFKKRQAKARLKNELKKIKKWSENAPENFLHHRLLMEAEMARLKGNQQLASSLYDEAIATAKRNEFLQYEALANELAALFYLKLGKTKIAKFYLHDARYCYKKWGAESKVKYLEQNYPQLLLQIKPIYSGKSTDSSEANTGHVLDFISLLKATQALTREIHLPNLIKKMMHIVVENAGAEKGVLLFEKNGSFYIEAIADSEKVQIIPSETSEKLPMSIIKTAQEKREIILIGNATSDVRFLSDPYITIHQPKSILCFPLINLGVIKGMLYLENNLSNDVFTQENLDTIHMLSTQMAISIDNALFYAQLEEKVTERTKALEDAQNQLLQKEKMAFLGMLTTGVAHEIKNPLNFILNFTQFSADVIEEMQNYLKKNNLASHQELTQGLQSLKENTQYITEQGKKADVIVNRMIEHSFEQKQQFVLSDIKKLLQQSLILSQQQLLKLYPFLDIQFKQEIDDPPCFIKIVEADIQRVIFNLLDNSYYSLFEKRKRMGDFYQPQITIKTINTLHYFEIHIRDNGEGIEQENLQKIFSPFFTTKPSGQGIGLGLSLCYTLIVEEHKGNLSFDSKLGEFSEFIIALPYS